MVSVRELVSGVSGAKGRMLLLAGGLVFVGFAWNGTREFVARGGKPVAGHSHTVFSKPGWTENSATKIGLLKKGDRWGDAAVRLGFSFGIAMLAGSILRAAFKTGLMLVLLSGVALWFLKTQGVVDLWDNYYGTVREGGNWLQHHFSAMGQFLSAHLPSAGAALAGFGLGLRR